MLQRKHIFYVFYVILHKGIVLFIDNVTEHMHASWKNANFLYVASGVQLLLDFKIVEI